MKKGLLLFLCLSLFLVSACSSSEETNTSTSNATESTENQADTEEQYFNSVLTAEPKTLDPSKGSDNYSANILAKMFDALVSVEVSEDFTETIVPAAAESWTISDDGTVYEFKIREHNWSDGQPVTASDFEYSMMRTLDPNTAAPYAYLLYSIKNAQDYNGGTGDAAAVGIQSIDDRTLRIELERPLPYFLQLCYFKTMYPQRQDYIEQYGEQYGSEAEYLIGNGAYTLSSWVHNSKLELKKNEHYWDQTNILLNDVNMNIVKDENVYYNLLFSKQIDRLGSVIDPQWQGKFEDLGLSKREVYGLGTNFSFYNTQDPLFKNEKVRLAFSVAIDKESMNKIIFKGKFEPAYGFVAKGIKLGKFDYNTEVPGALHEYKDTDPKALLIEGLKELGLSPDPAELDVTFFSSGAGGSFAKQYTDYLQQMYKTNLGVNLKLDVVDWPTFSSRVEKLDYQFGGMSWTADYNDPTTFLDIFNSNNTVVNTGWKNDRYDELLHLAELSTDDRERLEFYREAEEILLTSGPVAPTLYRKYASYKWPYVDDFRVPVLAPFNYKGVSIDGQR